MLPLLTDEQRQAIAACQGAPVHVLDAQSQSQYVLIPADAFLRIRGMFGDADPFDIQETYAIQDQAAAEAWDHPGDAEYDNYDTHRPLP